MAIRTTIRITKKKLLEEIERLETMIVGWPKKNAVEVLKEVCVEAERIKAKREKP